MHKFYIITILLLLFFNSILFASKGYTPKYGIPINEQLFWTEFKEMNNLEFNSMAEDDDGKIWFGGRGVIASFDKEKWSFFEQAGETEKDRVLSICPYKSNQVYCGFESGLFLNKEGVWHKVIPQQGEVKIQINEVKMFLDSSLWVASDKGIFVIQNKEITLYTTSNIGNEIHSEIPNVAIHYLNTKLSNGFDVVSICEGRNNEVWCALESKEIIRISRDNILTPIDIWDNLDKDKGAEIDMPQSLMLAQDGKIWAITSQGNRGINVFDPQKNKWSSIYLNKQFGGDNSHNSILQTTDGKIWIGGASRLFTFYNNSWEQHTNYSTTLPSGRIVLLEAKDGSVWIGGKHSNIYRLDYSQKRWNILSGLNYYCESSNNKLWFISSEKKIVVHDQINNKWTEYSTYDGIMDNPLILLVASNGFIWAAGSDHSIASTAYFNGKIWTKQSYPELGWCIHYRNFIESKDSSLWLGTYNTVIQDNLLGGIINIKLDKNNVINKTHYTSTETGQVDVMSIAQSTDGTLWTAGRFVGKFNGSRWEKVINPSELATGWLDEIKCTPNGGVWAANEGVGLFYLEATGEQWRKFTVQDGLANNTVLSILPLDDQTVLAGTEKGISRFDGNSWLTFALPKSITLKRDGGMLCKTSDGSIWINISASPWTNSAFGAITNEEKEYIKNNFKTIKYLPDNNPPKTEIIIAPNKVSDAGNIFLQWKGVDYLNRTPNNLIQYSYRLDNLQWSKFSYDTQKLFLSLGRGVHTFEIRARDSDLNIEKQIQKHLFIVSPPLWMQPWFITLIFIFVGIIIILIIYLYKKQIYIHDMEVAKVHEMDKMQIRYFTNLSHDLRTPLNLILGPLSDLMEKAKLKHEYKLIQQYSLMFRNAVRLKDLVNDIIVFRKLDSMGMEYTPSTGLIVLFVENIFNSFNSLALDRKIEFNFTVDFEDIYVSFDNNKLETILYNLLSNAFKYTPSEGVINLNLRFIQKKHDTELEIIVEDTGSGFPEDKIDTIFDRFIQLNTIKYGKEKSSGLGLAVTKELVEICRGSILAQNRIQIGAVFTVILPMQLITETTSDIKIQTDDVIDKINSSKSIDKLNSVQKQIVLVVEDFDDEREYLVEKLSENFDVVSAINGEDGILKAKEILPDLIISDIQMPKVDGFEFCRQIRADDVTSHIPFIFLTGNQLENIEIEGIQMGADGFISKPFQYTLLLAKVNSIFNNLKKRYKRFNEEFGFNTNDISSKDNEFIERAKEIVNSHIEDDLFDVAKFCSEIGMSRTQLFRKFKSLADITPNTFIRKIRLQKASFLLKNTQMNITEICYKVGYKYPGHFSQHFKNEFKMTPKEYQSK